MAAGWAPVASGGPAQFDEYGQPIPVQPAPDPFPEVKKKPIDGMARQAGILEPGITGQTMVSGQVPGARVPTPDPFAPPPEQPAAAAAVPLPSPRPPQAPTREVDGADNNAPTDISSSDRGSVRPQVAPDGGQAVTAPAVPPPAGPSIFGRIGNFLRDNSNTLLAIGAGFGGAPNIGQALSRTAAAAIPASQADIKNRTTLSSQSSTYRALIDAGVPPNQALGAIGNPTLMKTLIDSYIGDRKNEIKEVSSTDELGNKVTRLISINPYSNEVKELTAPGAKEGEGGFTSNKMLAPGVAKYDPTKVGEDYLTQFSPTIQASVKDYLAGRTGMTGRQGDLQTIKRIAQKYGNDIGMPADDNLISQRKVWGNSLADTKSGIGLQAKGFQQGLQHMSALSDKLVKLGNVSGVSGIEGEANFENWFKNLSTKDKAILAGVATDSQALAGEVGKLYSGSQGGGVHERKATMDRFSAPNMSGPVAAGSLEAQMELMEGGLHPLISRRDQLFPNGDAPRGSEFLGAGEKAAMEKIKRNIAILRGEAPATAAAAAPPPGRYRYDANTGSMVPVQ